MWEFYSRLKDSTAGFVVDKLFSIGAALATLVVAEIFVPVVDIVFHLYDPLYGFLTEYVEYCLAIFVATIVMWFLIWRDLFLRNILPYALGAIAILVSGLMRLGHGLPTIVWIEFLFYFTGVLILCEALMLHVVRLVVELLEGLGFFKRAE